MRPLRLASLIALLLLSCNTSDPASTADPLDDFMADLRAEYDLASIAIAVVADGEIVVNRAYGMANRETESAATPRTIYPLASCSKPIVGLAAAQLLHEQPELSLDDNINTILEWDPPVAHPDHPNTPITLRHLLTHRSGIAPDSDADYDTYPKPDPDQPLEAYLQDLLSGSASWEDFAPGAGEEYSNLGAALAALVIEVAAGEDFRSFCETRLFAPAGLNDTRWFYGDLSADQQARHAILYDGDTPYAIYGFNDYPSGLLRSTTTDMANLLITLMNGASIDAEVIDTFEDETLLINAGTEGGVRIFDHAGGEAGINTYFTYRSDGIGFVYLINSDLDDAALDAVAVALDERLLAEAQR